MSSTRIIDENNMIEMVREIACKGNDKELREYLSSHDVNLKDKTSNNETILEYLRAEIRLGINEKTNVNHFEVINTLLLYGAEPIDINILKNTFGFQMAGAIDWMAALFLMTGVKKLEEKDIPHDLCVASKSVEPTLKLVNRYATEREKLKQVILSGGGSRLFIAAPAPAVNSTSLRWSFF